MIRTILNKTEYIILFSTFLPYLLVDFGFRIEHIIVYSFFLVLLFKGWIINFDKKWTPPIITLFLSIFILVFYGNLINSTFSKYEFLSILSNFENYTEAFVLLLIFNSLLFRKGFFTFERILNINFFFQILLALNTCLIFIEIFTPYADYFLKYYVKFDAGGYRVGTNSMGRYMGVFNQPIESGLAYSLGILTWLYNFIRIRRGLKMIQVILFLFLLIGGLASASKVFFIGGLPLFIFMFLITGNIKSKFAFLGISIVSLTLIYGFFVQEWEGFGILKRLFNSITTNFSFSYITAGRIGEDDGIYSIIFNKSNSLLFFGNGFTIGDLPFLDSEYVQIIYQGGGIALILYIFLLIKNYAICYNLNKKFFPEKVLLFSILTIGVITALGGPVLFANRVSIFYIIQLFFLYQLSRTRIIKRQPER